MQERDIPLSVFHFDCYWMKPLQWCDFEWDRDAFPDPEGMLQRMGDKGLRRSVWINPYLGQRSPLFVEAARAGYLLRRPDGSVWQTDQWVAGMGMVDFTNPAARDWFAGKVRALLDSGVDAIKTDFGERVPVDVVWHDGSDPALMHNYYTLLYNQTVFDEVRRARGDGEAVLFARSATVGGQQFPVHWGGDCESSYQSMAESLRGGLSLGLAGFGFWSHDIGGFEGTPSAALFKRWTAFGLLSSHSRLHGSESYRVPWAFDDEAVDVTREFAELKNRLMPYLWGCAVEAHRVGIPVMRAMLLEFPDDRDLQPARPAVHARAGPARRPGLRRRRRRGVLRPAWPLGGAARRPGRRGPRLGPAAARRPLPAAARAPRCGDRAWAAARTGPTTTTPSRRSFEVFDLADGTSSTTHLYDDQGRERVSVQVSRDGNRVVAEVVAGLEHLVRRLEPDLGDRALRQPHRTHRPSGVRCGDPAAGPRPGLTAARAGLPCAAVPKVVCRNIHSARRSAESPNRPWWRDDVTSSALGRTRSNVPPRGTLRPEELKRNNMGRLLTRVHLGARRRAPRSPATWG